MATNVSNEKLLNAANGRVTAFTASDLLRENQQEKEGVGGRGGGAGDSPTQTRVKCVYYDFFGTFFVIPETYQVLVLNLKWISLRQ